MFVPVFNKGDIQMDRIYKLTIVKKLKGVPRLYLQ